MKIKPSQISCKVNFKTGEPTEKPIHETLAMYDRGEDITDSPFVRSGQWKYHISGKTAHERQKDIISLYESIKKHGYNGSPLLVWYDSNDNINLYDGFHRVAIMHYLKIDEPVQIETNWKGIDGMKGKPKMKLHILSDPGWVTTDKVRTQFFPYDVWKFIRHYKDKYNLVHYGLAGAEVGCKHYDLPKDLRAWNAEASKLIDEEKQPGDIILCYGGKTNQAATTFHTDCYVIEPHIGYNTSNVFAPYRVWKSYNIMSFYYGAMGYMLHPQWNDRVIPNGITTSEFTYSEQKEDYVLYLGRVIESKGVNVAIQATEKAGQRLVIAGSPRKLSHMGYKNTPKHVELVGHTSVDQRRVLLSKAKALIAPTYYFEPFGNMVIEAHLSGTPTITTDWGAFPETNINGVTGYRCRTFKDFLWALNNTDSIDKKAMYKRAVETYSDEVIYPQYEPYFNQIIKNSWYD